eukprot:4374513-Prymnesium_polylepis.1
MQTATVTAIAPPATEARDARCALGQRTRGTLSSWKRVVTSVGPSVPWAQFGCLHSQCSLFSA